MSFGFSVGDFLAVIGLVTQLRKDFADAPSQVRDLSAELKTFSIVLQDAEVDLTSSDLDAQQLEALESTLAGARDFLQDLQKFIDHHKEISNSTNSKSRGNLKRIWKRLNFDQQEVSKFRLQISSIISGLQAFTSNEIKHNTRKIARYVDKQVHRDILKWLSEDDFNYHKNYQSHLVRNRQAGTRKWLLGSDEWKLWLKSGGQTLYCPGIPGSGKTYTTAMVIENMVSLSEEHGWVFGYVFCNYQQRKEDMHEVLLRSLLRMILEQTQQISDEVQQWPTRNKAISIDEILEQLQITLKECPRSFIIVDALDELDMFQDVVSCLFDLQNAVDVNLYFTSRDIPHIRAFFDKAMLVPVKATKHDVEVYLDDQMRMSHVPNFVRNNQVLQDEIKKTIVSTVGEIFLLADLQFKQLMQTKSTRRLQIALKAVLSGTSTYETAYEAAMERIQSQDKRLCELAKNAISILAYAERPLLAPELVHALSVDLDFDKGSYVHEIGNLHSMSDSLGVYDPDLEPTVEEVLAASAGLIVHQPDSGIVQLVHKTTKEYLTSESGRQKWFPQAQLTIAAICLIYSQAFEDSGGTTNWQFLDYAQKHYGHHIMAHQKLERCKDPTLVQSSHKPVSTPDSSLLQAQQLIDQIGLARMAEELSQTEDALIKASERNQLNLVRVLLSTEQYNLSPRPSEKARASLMNAKADRAMVRALLAAVENGHLELADFLLRSGAGSRSEGHSKNIEADLLSEADSLYEADCAIDQALLVAVRNGHTELVDLLLKNGANPMMEVSLRDLTQGFCQNGGFTIQNGSLLTEASLFGHHNVVGYLLDNGFYTMDMMQHDRDGFRHTARTPPEPGDFYVISPVCVAAYRGHVPCVDLLLKWIGIENNTSGRDIERDRILENVTLCAMIGLVSYHEDHAGVLEILPRLSTRNIDSMIGRLGDPNLLFTSIRWHQLSYSQWGLTLEPMAEFLVSTYTFDWSARDETGADALLAATKQDMAAVVRLILEENDNSLNWQDQSGRTPVSWAAERCHSTLPVLLGHKGVCLDLVDYEGRAPIDYLLEHYWRDTEEVLPLMVPLLEQGINTIDRHGCTLLHDLIEATDHEDESLGNYKHWKVLTSYEGRNIFERRHDPDEEGEELDRRSRKDNTCYILDVSILRHILGAVSISAAEIRFSSCKCGIGTIFLAVSTENVELVEVLLDFYPDLVNDKFFDGSSLLDLASCIVDQQRRQSMCDLILSKNPAI